MKRSEKIVREFWRMMAADDFASGAAVLADDLVVDWRASRSTGSSPRSTRSGPRPAAHRRHLTETMP